MTYVVGKPVAYHTATPTLVLRINQVPLIIKLLNIESNT